MALFKWTQAGINRINQAKNAYEVLGRPAVGHLVTQAQLQLAAKLKMTVKYLLDQGYISYEESLDGQWSEGSIYANTLRWNDDPGEVVPIVREGPSKLSMDDGDTAELINGRLHWSDGDVWERGDIEGFSYHPESWKAGQVAWLERLRKCDPASVHPRLSLLWSHCRECTHEFEMP